MFGGRIVPAAFIALCLAGLLFIAGGAAERLTIIVLVPAGLVGPIFALIGFAAPIGIALFDDYRDSKREEQEDWAEFMRWKADAAKQGANAASGTKPTATP